jgi:hypothetical protein
MRTPLVTAAVLIAVTLAGCNPVPPAPTPEPTVATETPVETPTPTPTVENAGLSDADYLNLSESISSGNTAALEGYLADDVSVIIAASECCMGMSVVDSLNALAYLNDAPGPWTFPTDPAEVATFATGSYSQYFPEGAYVGNSSGEDPFIVSFTIVGDKVTTIFMSAGASLLTE